ncbi:MAG: LamG-like jellyroll fold domain-containing protein [Gemmataceae bacterium]
MSLNPFARKNGHKKTAPRKQQRARLQVESLESRITPSAVTTDRPDYHVGENVLITGTGFQPGETIELQVIHTDGQPDLDAGHAPWQIVEGGSGDLDGLNDGNFQTTWVVTPDSAHSMLRLTAVGLTSGFTAQADFTDGPVLSPINSQVINKGGTLQLTASASGGSGTITYGLDSAPAGATMNSSTGAFSWTAPPTDAVSWWTGDTLAGGQAVDAATGGTGTFTSSNPIDDTFAGSGHAATDVRGFNDVGHAVVVDSAGRSYVAGSSASGAAAASDDFVITRYTAAGVLDTTFGSGGSVITDFAGLQDEGQGMVIDSAGRLYVAGHTYNGSNWDFALARYTTSGVLDSTFGSGGKVTTDFAGRDDLSYGAIALDASGRVFVGGYTFDGVSPTFSIACYTSAGVLDSTFGAGGKVTTDINTQYERINALTVDSSGRIVAVGFANNNTDFALARYTAAGALDSTFGSGGIVVSDFSGAGRDDGGWAVTIDSSGNILVAGNVSNGSNTDFALARYTAAGVLDSSFGSGGKVSTDFTGHDDQAYGVAVDGTGKIVVAGYSANGSNNDFAVARYTSAGALDTTFASAGKITTDFAGRDDSGFGMTLDASGRIVVAGATSNGANLDLAVARYLDSAPATATGKVGQALSFDGRGNLNTNLTVNYATGVTFDAWVKTTASAGMIMAGGGGDSTKNGMSLFIQGGLATLYGSRSTSGVQNFLIQGGSAINDGAWHHLAATWTGDATANGVKLYVDGALVAQATANGSITGGNDSTPLYLGGHGTIAHTKLVGAIDEADVFRRVLSATEIQAIYASANEGKGPLTTPTDAVSWWKAEGNASDSSGANSGALTNGATTAPGRIGQAFSFDGVDDYVSVPNAANLNPTSAISVDAWVSVSSTGTFQYFVNKFNHNGGSADDSYTLGALANGNIRWQIDTNNGGVQDNILDTTGVNIYDGKFHHLAGTYDGSTMRLYVDGTQVASRSAAGPIMTTSTNVLLGAALNNGTPAFFMKGLLDEAAVSSRALSAAEIKAIYDSGSAGKGQTAIGGYRRSVTVRATDGVAAFDTKSFSIQVASLWVGGSGDWNTTANWSNNTLPGANDDVYISVAGTQTVTHSSGSHTVRSIYSDENFTVSGGTLTVNGDMTINGNLSITGGTLVVNGTLKVTGTFSASAGTLKNATVTTTSLFDVLNDITLDGVTLGVNTTLETGAQVTVLNNLTLANNILLRLVRNDNNGANTGSDVGLNFSGGAQTLGGTGTVELFSNVTFNNSTPNLNTRLRPTSGSLAIGVGVTVQIASNSGGVTVGDATLPLTIAGTVLAQSSGQTLAVTGSSVSNTGTVRVIGSGVLQLAVTPTNFSGSTLTGGSWEASAGGTLRVPLSSTITTNAASIVLDGASSNFYRDAGTTKALVGLATNTGTLTLANGYVLVTTSDIANQGTLNIDTTSKLQTGLANQVSLWSGEGNANDSVDGNTGTLTNGATATATGRLGQALSFDGVNDYVNVPDANNLDLSGGSFTISAWIKPAATGSTYQVIADKSLDNTSLDYDLALNGSLQVQFWSRNLSNSLISPAVSAGVWTHVAIAEDIGATPVESARLRLYVNGVLVDSAATVAGSAVTNAASLLIGARHNTGGSSILQYFGGLIDEASIYSRALTSAEIASIASADTVTQTAGTTNLGTGGILHGGIDLQGGLLKGSGTVRGDVENAATVAPGNSPGIITINGNYTQSPAGSLNIEIQGTNAATPDYDQVFVNGVVSLAGSLNVSFLNGFITSVGASFKIIDNDDIDAVAGTFAGLSEGAAFAVGSRTFRISYTGGTGNDVVLTDVTGSVFWDGGAGTFNWNDAANWSGDLLPGVNDNVVIPDLPGTPTITSTGTVSVRSLIANEKVAITSGSITVAQPSAFAAGLDLSGGTLTANGALSVTGLNFTGGTLTANAAVTLQGASAWTGGTMGGSATVTNAGTLSISSASNKILGVTFSNTGTVTEATAITINSTITNQSGALWNATGDFTFLNGVGGGTFNNIGTFRKSAGTGITAFGDSTNVISFNNQGGTVDVQTGTLNVRGGTSTGGTYTVSNSAVIAVVAGQTFTGTHTGTGAGQFNVTGSGGISVGAAGATLNFVSGMLTFVGTGLGTPGNTLTNSGFIKLDATLAAIALGGTLTNNGTITQTGANNVRGSSATINNQSGALYNLTSDGGFGTIAGVFNINNAGTFRKSAGTGTSAVGDASNVVNFNNQGGTIDVQTGTLNLRGGTSTGGAYTVSNSAVLGLTTTQIWTGTHTGTGAGRVNLSGGITAGAVATDTVTLNFASNLLHLTGGWGGPGTIANNGFMTIDGGFNVGGTLNNAGTVTHATGTIGLSSATINNQATGIWDLTGDGGFSNFAGTNAINNAGTFRKSGGTGTSTVSTLSNTNTVSVTSGTLSFSAVSQISSNTLNAGVWNVGAGATLGLPGTINTIAAGVSVTLTGVGASLPNLASNLNTNNGSFTVTGGASFTRAASVVNAGTLTVGTGGGVVTTNGVSMSGAGAAVTIASGGTLAIAGTTNTYSTTGGTTTVNGTLSNTGSTSAGAVLINTGGTLVGTGTVQGNLTVNGTLNPGAIGTAGTLSVTGNYTQGGTLSIDMLGASPGQYDVLAVSGSVTFNGGSRLVSQLLGGFSLGGGSAFQVLTFGSRPGSTDFTSKILESPANRYLDPAYSSGALTLTDRQTNNVSWTGGGNDFLWSNPLNWSGGVTPGAGDNVDIPDLTGTPTITVNGTITVNSLTAAEKIAFTGGTFTINNSAAFNGGLDSSGSALNIFGNATATNVNLSGGNLTVSEGKTFTWTGAASVWSGGQISGAGTVRNTGSVTMNATTTLAGSFANASSFTQTAGQMNLSGVFTNEGTGTFTEQSTTSPQITGSGTFSNAGAFSRPNSGAVSLLAGFTNATGGSVQVASGAAVTMTGLAAPGTTHNGSFSIASSASITWSNGTTNFGSGASITGAGTAQFNAGTYNVNANLGSTSVNISGGTMEHRFRARPWSWSGASTGALERHDQRPGNRHQHRDDRPDRRHARDHAPEPGDGEMDRGRHHREQQRLARQPGDLRRSDDGRRHLPGELHQPVRGDLYPQQREHGDLRQRVRQRRHGHHQRRHAEPERHGQLDWNILRYGHAADRRQRRPRLQRLDQHGERGIQRGDDQHQRPVQRRHKHERHRLDGECHLQQLRHGHQRGRGPRHDKRRFDVQ